jgi:FkbM family methyltransferase
LRFLLLQLLRLKKLWLILLQPMLRRAFFQHCVMAGVEHKAALNRPLSTVVDIGANRGQFALAARAISGAKVFSFEALPVVAVLFQKVFSADSAVRLQVAAIGERAERKLIHLSARDDSSSLLEIGEAQSNFFPGTHEVGTLEVEVGPLAKFAIGGQSYKHRKRLFVEPYLIQRDVLGMPFYYRLLSVAKRFVSTAGFVLLSQPILKKKL